MRQLVEEIRAVVKAGPVDKRAIQKLERIVKDRLGSLQGTNLCQGDASCGELKPGRYLCYKDPDYHFVIMILAWGRGDATPIHDHGTWGVEAVLKNSLLVTQYSCCETNPEPMQSFVAPAGFVMHNLPPDRDVHKVSHHGGELALSLHVYGREMTGNRMFIPGEGFKTCKLETRELSRDFDLGLSQAASF